MSIPSHIEFARPVLEALAKSPEGLPRPALYTQMADWAKLTPPERAETISSGQEKYKSRVGWACAWLRLAGLVENPSRGLWRITSAGRDRIKKDARPFTHAELRPARPGPNGSSTEGSVESEVDADSASPEERIVAASEDILAELGARLLARLKSNSPEFFERAVLLLLEAMGYGRPEHKGGSGDRGIDGVLYLDKLGLERVYVQAKRWDGDVPRDRVQALSGAMDEHHAAKGVLVTVGAFAKSARESVQRLNKVILLIDGEELSRLMVEHGVGVVTRRTIDIKDLDEGFFEE